MYPSGSELGALKEEVARYRTCPGDGPFDCDPSRTSVNLHGDVVVTNRYPTSDGTATINPDTVERSSVTKFAADRADCVDRNDDGFITTSTGGDDVLAFGEDECMLWNQDLGLINGIAPRARATAWDGSEDPDTGEGGVVVIGTCLAGQDPDDASNPDDVEWSIENNQLIMMSGDTGDILNTIAIPSTECFYGGAMDPEGNFWVMDGFGFPSNVVSGGLIRVNLASETVTRFENHCGYGISVDADGNVWTSGKHWESNATPNETSCVQKFSATTELPEETPTYLGQFLRGIAVGSGKSAGYVWSAETRGALYKVNQANLADVEVIPTPVSETTVACQSDDNCENGLVGVAIDYEGYVWMVSTTENTAYKYDPESGDFTAVVIGDQPYTYSDMTGMQLRGVVIIE